MLLPESLEPLWPLELPESEELEPPLLELPESQPEEDPPEDEPDPELPLISTTLSAEPSSLPPPDPLPVAAEPDFEEDESVLAAFELELPDCPFVDCPEEADEPCEPFEVLPLCALLVALPLCELFVDCVVVVALLALSEDEDPPTKPRTANPTPTAITITITATTTITAGITPPDLPFDSGAAWRPETSPKTTSQATRKLTTAVRKRSKQGYQQTGLFAAKSQD